jgi:cell division cycle 2-like
MLVSTNLHSSDTKRVYIVIDFTEHDLKNLLTVVPYTFLQPEIKTLLIQLPSAAVHCHKNWILHRDLKMSNLLMNNRGQIKVTDSGLARCEGDSIGVGGLMQLVVTLMYRYVLNSDDTIKIKSQSCSTEHQKS